MTAAEWLSNQAMTHYAPGLSYWTGWTRDPRMGHPFGQFLWTGVAHFWSGRSHQVFYYCNVVAPSDEAVRAHPLYGILKATEFYNKVVRLAKQGFLYKWTNGRKLRPIRRVDWERWHHE